MGADFRAGLNDREGANGDACAEGGRGVYYSSGVDAGGRKVGRVEQTQRGGKGGARLGAAEERAGGGGEVGCDDEAGSGAAGRGGPELFVTDEGEIGGAGRVELGGGLNQGGGVAFEIKAEALSQFIQAHNLTMPIDPGACVAPTARIHPEAEVGPGCVIGEYCVVEQDVRLGPNCVLEPHVYVKRWTTMGEGNQISAGTVLGTDPLDKNFKGERSYLRIGDRNKIREHFTISRATKPEAETVIGDDNFIMTSGHIAHDCRLGNQIVVASCALLAGYVEVEDQAFISGGVVVHQFSKIGRLTMVGGNTRVNSDLPPFFLYSKFDVEVEGLNVVGMRRAGFSAEEVGIVKTSFRILYKSGLKKSEACQRLDSLNHPLADHIARFVRDSKRGIARGG